jgi:ubiquinone/menaquinone biosynthesis C-methylase UbiE
MSSRISRRRGTDSQRLGRPHTDRPVSEDEVQNTTYDRIAPLYDLLDAPHEYGWRRRLRGRLFDGLTGRVLDAGAGTGANVPFYPPGAEMVAVDASPKMLARAERRSAALGKPVSVQVMDLLKTDFPDAHFDAIVSTFVFCVLENNQQLPALREMRRICKPDGVIKLLDYRLSEKPLLRRTMEVVSSWSGWAFDSRYRPTTEAYIEAAGLDLVESRFVFGDIVKLLILRPSPAPNPPARLV